MTDHGFNRRQMLGGMTAGLSAMSFTPRAIAAATTKSEIRIQRLDWTGLRIETTDTVAYIDAVPPEDPKRAANMAFTSTKKNRVGLITHEHGDHYDSAYLASLIGSDGTLICHHDTASAIFKADFRVKEVAHWEPVFLPRMGADMIAMAVPASDGFGVPQVSWIIKAGDKKIIHCGDTLWHGYFANIAALHGPFDCAFLPINGARQNLGRFVDVEVPMVLTPEQAVAAARILNARTIVPVHYGSPDPPTYIEIEKPLERLMIEAKRRGVDVKLLNTGEWMSLA
jgi:L-ascorbate metabolism protein UlaG (beta-lactamase superfamily)